MSDNDEVFRKADDAGKRHQQKTKAAKDKATALKEIEKAKYDEDKDDKSHSSFDDDAESATEDKQPDVADPQNAGKLTNKDLAAQ